MSRLVALLSLIIILGLVNWSILTKEKHLAEGQIVYLKLAPVDPRSLMQGDYMALRFQIEIEIRKALAKEHARTKSNTEANQEALMTTDTTESADLDASDSYVIVTLDERKIGTFKSLDQPHTLAKNELRMQYRVRNDVVKFATNAFFFQEGHAKYYQSAQYGQFRVNNKGELLLVSLYDRDLNQIKPM